MGYKKQLLAFSKDSTIFGKDFKSSIDTCFCRLSRMVFMGKINPDGTIDTAKADAFTKAELWSYIYYLFNYNYTTIPEFKVMKAEENATKSATAKASAIGFYNSVAAVLGTTSSKPTPFPPQDLITFINRVLIENKDSITNPIFDYLQALQDKKVIAQMKNIKLVTGKNAGVLEVLTNANAAKNANVKITLH